MQFPETLDALRHAGYRFSGEAHCKGCAARIEWWTTPEGKHIPLDVDGEKVTPHWSTCTQAHLFRKEKPWSKSKPANPSKAKQPSGATSTAKNFQRPVTHRKL